LITTHTKISHYVKAVITFFSLSVLQLTLGTCDITGNTYLWLYIID